MIGHNALLWANAARITPTSLNSNERKRPHLRFPGAIAVHGISDPTCGVPAAARLLDLRSH